MRVIIFLLFALGILLLDSCYYDNAEELYPNSFCDTANVTYSGTIDPIIQAKCATPGCHVAGGTGTGDFTVFSVVQAAALDGSLLGSARRDAGAIPMPPDETLPACELRQIEQWVAAGAPNN